MTKLLIQLTVLACCTLLFTSCNKNSVELPIKNKALSAKEETMTETNELNLTDSRANIPFSRENATYLTEIIQSVVRVISKQTNLDQEEIFLGPGKDQAPKDVGPVRLRFYYKESVGRGTNIIFERRSDKSTWFQGSFKFIPFNYPKGVYDMDLPESFFTGMTLEQAYIEERPNSRPKRLNIFVFSSHGEGVKIKLKFESREEVSNLNDKYPKSFHSVEITRLDT